jgi:hypothetical protein
VALSKYIAACGFDCRECPAYKATQSNDQAERERIAEKWSKANGQKMTTENILCDGCRADGRIVAYCATCNIKTCALEKGYPTCAHCPDMPDCGKITRRQTREMLETLKKGIKGEQ